jgi:hypothetical protein
MKATEKITMLSNLTTKFARQIERETGRTTFVQRKAIIDKLNAELGQKYATTLQDVFNFLGRRMAIREMKAQGIELR